MLLSQQAKLISFNSNSAEIAISAKWINMIQSRKNLIEDAFQKASGCPTKVTLIQQKENLLHQQEEKKISSQELRVNESEISPELNKSNLEDLKKIQPENIIDAKSFDKKAKQFADFFNGEIINLE